MLIEEIRSKQKTAYPQTNELISRNYTATLKQTLLPALSTLSFPYLPSRSECPLSISAPTTDCAARGYR